MKRPEMFPVYLFVVIALMVTSAVISPYVPGWLGQ